MAYYYCFPPESSNSIMTVGTTHENEVISMKHKFQISESIRLGAILALSGGFMDAYSYMERGEVFANAQTGNMLLFGVHLSEGDFQNTMKYLFPVLAFALGIALAEVVRAKAGNLLHWRQISVLAEALILIAVSFFPTALNLPANALTSFACGIQVESFRKILCPVPQTPHWLVIRLIYGLRRMTLASFLKLSLLGCPLESKSISRI